MLPARHIAQALYAVGLAKGTACSEAMYRARQTELAKKAEKRELQLVIRRRRESTV